MSRSAQMQIPSGLVLFSPLCSCRPLAKAIHPSASASGLFPLGLRTPCSLVPPVPRTPSLRVGSSGRLLFGGRKASFPQLGLLLVPSESALRTTPFLVFICESVVSLPLRDKNGSGERRRSSLSHGRS